MNFFHFKNQWPLRPHRLLWKNPNIPDGFGLRNDDDPEGDKENNKEGKGGFELRVKDFEDSPATKKATDDQTDAAVEEGEKEVADGEANVQENISLAAEGENREAINKRILNLSVKDLTKNMPESIPPELAREAASAFIAYIKAPENKDMMEKWVNGFGAASPERAEEILQGAYLSYVGHYFDSITNKKGRERKRAEPPDSKKSLAFIGSYLEQTISRVKASAENANDYDERVEAVDNVVANFGNTMKMIGDFLKEGRLDDVIATLFIFLKGESAPDVRRKSKDQYAEAIEKSQLGFGALIAIAVSTKGKEANAAFPGINDFRNDIPKIACNALSEQLEINVLSVKKDPETGTSEIELEGGFLATIINNSKGSTLTMQKKISGQFYEANIKNDEREITLAAGQSIDQLADYFNHKELIAANRHLEVYYAQKTVQEEGEGEE